MGRTIIGSGRTLLVLTCPIGAPWRHRRLNGRSSNGNMRLWYNLRHLCRLVDRSFKNRAASGTFKARALGSPGKPGTDKGLSALNDLGAGSVSGRTEIVMRRRNYEPCGGEPECGANQKHCEPFSTGFGCLVLKIEVNSKSCKADLARIYLKFYRNSKQCGNGSLCKNLFTLKPVCRPPTGVNRPNRRLRTKHLRVF